MADKRQIKVTILGDDKTGASTRSAEANLDGLDAKLKELRGSFDQYGESNERANKHFDAFKEGTRGLLEIPAKIAALTAGAGAIASLGAAAGALGAAIAPAAGVYAAYPVIMTAIGQAAGVASLALSGVSDAAGKIEQAGDDPKKLQAAVQGLTPDAAALAQQLAKLNPVLDGLKSRAQAGLLPGLSTDLTRLTAIVPAFGNELQATGSVLSSFATQATQLLIDRQGLLHEALNNNLPIIRNLGTAGLGLGDALLHVVVAAQPMVQVIAEGAARLGAFVDKAATAGQETGRLGDFFERSREVASQLGRVVENLAVGLFHAASAGSSMGQGLLDQLERGTKAFRDFTASAKGQSEISDYFARAQPTIEAVIHLIGAISKDFGALASKTDLAPIIDALRTDLLPVLDNIANSSTSNLLPALVQLATAFAKIFAQLSTQSSSLHQYLRFITDLAQGFAWLLDNTPGLVKFIGLITVLKVALSLGKGIGEITGLTKVIGSLSDEASGLRRLASGFTSVEAASAESSGKLGSLGGLLGSVWTVVRTGISSLATLVASWAAAGASAVASAARTVASWVAQGAAAAASAARSLAAFAVQIAEWAVMGAAALAGAAAVAAAWLISIAPIALVIAAIVGVVVLVVKHWGEIKDATVAAWDFVKNAVETVVKFLISLFENFTPEGLIVKHWSAIVSATTDLWNAVKRLFTDGISAVLGFLGGLADKALSAVGDLGSNLYGWAKAAFVRLGTAELEGLQIILGYLTGLPAKALAAAGDLASALYGWGKAAFERLGQAERDGASAVLDFLGGIPGRAVAALDGIGDSLATRGRQLIAGLFDGVRAGWSDVTGFLGSVDDKARAALGALGSALVSKGHDLLAGLSNGVQDGFDSVATFLSQIGRRALSAVGNLGGVMLGVGRSIINGLLDGIEEGFDKVKSTLGKLTNLLPSWKGPADRDAVLLKPAGRLVIGSLDDGLRESFPRVQATLSDLTDLLGMQAGGTDYVMGRLAATSAAAPASGQVTGGPTPSPAAQAVQYHYHVDAPGAYAEPITEDGLVELLDRLALLHG